MLFSTAVLVLTAVVLVYLYLTWDFKHWKKRGVNGPRPRLVVGNYLSMALQNRHIIYDLDDIYRKYKKDEDFVGIYSGANPQLLITSPALARRICVDYFKHFHDNEVSRIFNQKSDFVFTLTGQEWKEKRAELIPGLSLGRVKAAYLVTDKISKRMTKYIREQAKQAPKNGLNSTEICLRFTSEVVTECVLGLNADSFGQHPTPILGMLSKVFNTSATAILCFITLKWFFPSIERFHKVNLVPKPTEEFFKFLLENGIDFCKSQRKLKPHETRIDFLDYMLQLQELKHLSASQLTAHTLTFMLKGFKQTGLVISHCLLLLARHPKIQQNLRSEIERHVYKNEVMDFDTLMQLPYLNACVHEAIRIFPPGYFSNKLCTDPIELVNKNGHILHVQKGDVIVLPLYSLMMDDNYYPNPQEFQPRRFMPKNGGVRKYFENGVFCGFGQGPRVCLGTTFALAQAKAAIAEILRNFYVRVNPKTRNDNIWDPKTLHMHLEGGIWLDFEEIN